MYVMCVQQEEWGQSVCWVTPRNKNAVQVNQQNTVQGSYRPNEVYMLHIRVEPDHPYLDALHCDVVDHPNDATRPGHSQQRMACVGVVGPGTRVEVLICLCTCLVKEIKTKTFPKRRLIHSATYCLIFAFTHVQQLLFTPVQLSWTK